MSNDSYSNFNPYIVASGRLDLQNCPAKGTLYNERIVRWYEMELMNEVDGGYVITDGDNLCANTGDIFIRKPGMIVRGVSGYGCNSIIFDSMYDTALKKREYEKPIYDDATVELLQHMNERLPHFQILDDLPHQIKIEDYPYFKRLFNKCLDHYINQKDDFQFYAKVILYNILYTIHHELKKQYNIISPNDSHEHKYKGILEAKQFIDGHFNKRIELKELAQIAGYNPDFFCRLFKKIVGKPPIDYLIQARLVYAKRMLITTNTPINEIAWSCGFQNETYFYTLFKKNENITPGKYRAYNQHLF